MRLPRQSNAPLGQEVSLLAPIVEGTEGAWGGDVVDAKAASTLATAGLAKREDDNHEDDGADDNDDEPEAAVLPPHLGS